MTLGIQYHNETRGGDFDLNLLRCAALPSDGRENEKG